MVHGIRFLQAAKGARPSVPHVAVEARELAGPRRGGRRHRQARAIASSSYSHRRQGSSPSGTVDADTQLQVDAYVALLDLLNDRDAFVVAKAVEGLSDADLAVAVEPLVKAAAKHPELAANVFEILGSHANMRTKAIVYLRKFCKHEKPRVRAAAIAALATAAADDIEDELSAALADNESEVRRAARPRSTRFSTRPARRP